ncbi:MAG: methylated-DNA--[protein]-cysteine S-methyltransferase [Bacillota bacterium]
MVYDSYQAPFGIIRVILDEKGLKRVAITPECWDESLAEFGSLKRDENRCSQVILQLDEYFRGKRRQFKLALSGLEGPEFSVKVWRALLEIPFGETRSYSEIAASIGSPKSRRAVGQANRRNPLPIFIPCHRVIGKNGDLTGYVGKGYLDFKKYLLEMEKAFSA